MNKLYQVNRFKNSFDPRTLSDVVSSLAINKMLYCSSVWSNTSASYVKKFQSIENFAKIITKTRNYDHVTPLLRELDWLPVDKLLYFRDSVLTYKCLTAGQRSFAYRAVHLWNNLDKNLLRLLLT